MPVRRLRIPWSVDPRQLATAAWAGLAQTLFAPSPTTPWRSASQRRLARLAAIVGGLVLALVALKLARQPVPTVYARRIVLIGLLGMLLIVPRFPLIVWRLGLLAALLIPVTVRGAV